MIDFTTIPNAYEIGAGIASGIVAILGLIAGITNTKSRLFFAKIFGKPTKKAEFDISKLIEDLKLGSIYEKLASFRQQYDASRIRICQFHNGGHFLDGSPIKKFSATHETCKPGSTIESFHLQNIQLTVFWELIDYIRKNSPDVIDIDQLSEVSTIKTWMESRNIKQFAILPLHSNDFISGFVVMEWEKVTEFDQFDVNFVKCRESLEMDLGKSR